MTLKDWATETGIPVHCLIRRLDSGWCVSEALCKGRRGPRILTCNGQSRTITEWARHLGISREILYVRISKGWSMEKVLSGDRYNRRNKCADQTVGQEADNLVEDTKS